MLSNLPVMFNDSMSNPLRVTCDTSWKLQTFSKSRAIILNKSRQKYTTKHADQYFCKVSWLYVKSFFSYMRHQFKIAKFNLVKGNNSKNTK
jgi:hypothetical protein